MKYSKEAILSKYKELKERLRRRPTAVEFYCETGFKKSSLLKIFGNNTYSRLQEICGDIPYKTGNRKPPPVKILFADDNAADCYMFRKALEQVGLNFKVTVVPDGTKAINLLHAGDFIPDIIFLDINMPLKNGRECLEEIRKHDTSKNIPVIVYSVSSERTDMEEMYKRGANLYLVKATGYENEIRMLKKLFSLNWHDYGPNLWRERFILS